MSKVRLTRPFILKQLGKKGTFQGYASIFDLIDSDGDIIQKGAFERTIQQCEQGKKTIYVLWQHQGSEPIGILDHLKEDQIGLFVQGRLLLDVQRGREAYSLLKEQALRGLSIGFVPIETDYDAKGTRLIQQVDLLEVSLVTFPSNPLAGVHAIKEKPATLIHQPKEGKIIMQKTEVTSHDHLKKTWEDYKEVNQERLAQCQKNGQADPLTEHQLATIDRALEEQQNCLAEEHLQRIRPRLDQQICKQESGSYPHQKAFENYLRKGISSGLEHMEAKSLSSVSQAEGGYLIPVAIEKKIQEMLFDRSSMRQLCAIESISTDSLEMLQETDDLEAGWVLETEARKDTKNPEFRKHTIRVHEMYAQPKATQKLIDDARIDIGQWISGKIVDKFSRMENHSFLHGDGVGKPRGLLTYPKGNEWGKIENFDVGTLETDDFLIALDELKDAYAANASFLMHPSTIRAVRMLKDRDGRYLWSPDISGHGGDMLFGHRIYRSVDMPTCLEGNTVVAVGDFKSAYQILDRTHVRLLRDPYTDKPFIKFYATKRVGGDVKRFDAVKLMTISKAVVTQEVA